jgi:tRNA/rRNA methyltransferase
VVILLRPQLGANIGAVARAMLNFGLGELRLVAPRDGWPNPEAGPAASGADVVLEEARLFGTLAEACADLGLVFATAMAPRALTRRQVTPERAVAEVRALGATGAGTGAGTGARAGLLFGPERTGLDTVDVALAHALCTIPANPDFASLNLAQAVAVLGYEWQRQQGAMLPEVLHNYTGPAPLGQLEALIADLDARLTANRYYSPGPGRVEAARLTLRNLLTRPQFSEAEVRTLRGVVRILAAPRGKAATAPETADQAGSRAMPEGSGRSDQP